jgi:hypothetical protein
MLSRYTFFPVNFLCVFLFSTGYSVQILRVSLSRVEKSVVQNDLVLRHIRSNSPLL